MKKTTLPADEDHEVPAPRARERPAAHPPADELAEVPDELPLDDQEPVEHPEIEVLPSVEGAPPLVRAQAGEHAEVDVRVVAGDVDMGMMEDAVLPAPQVGAPAQELQRHRRERVDPSGPRIGLMAAIVLDVAPDPGREEAEEDGEQRRLPPRLCREHEQEIGAGEAGQEDRRLQVLLPAVARRPAGGPEVRVDPFPERQEEGRIAAEGQPPALCRGVTRAASRPRIDRRLTRHARHRSRPVTSLRTHRVDAMGRLLRSPTRSGASTHPHAAHAPQMRTTRRRRGQSLSERETWLEGLARQRTALRCPVNARRRV